MHRLLVLLIAITAATTVIAEDPSDWTTQLPPFRIADNLYYVGSRDLAAYLVTTPDGNILINANLASSPPQIRASVEKLGFRRADTKILINSQAHFDHVGGAAEVLRETKARDYVMTGDDAAMRSGGRDDFSHDLEQLRAYTPVAVDRVLQDGDKVTLGGVTLTAHRTAGHTRGCTTWTMDVHVPGEPAGKLRHVVIVGGWAPLPHYQLVDAPGHPASYPGIADDFRQTFATLHALPCDIFLGAHGVYFDLLPKLQRMPKEGAAVFIDPAGYRTAVNEAEADFQAMYDKQRAATSHKN
jgi:metallo-beta-lactamase class B